MEASEPSAPSKSSSKSASDIGSLGGVLPKLVAAPTLDASMDDAKAKEIGE